MVKSDDCARLPGLRPIYVDVSRSRNGQYMFTLCISEAPCQSRARLAFDPVDCCLSDTYLFNNESAANIEASGAGASSCWC